MVAMIRQLSIHFARCTSCGLRIKLHRDQKNRSLSCAEAQEQHRYASIRHRRLRAVMLESIGGKR